MNSSQGAHIGPAVLQSLVANEKCNNVRLLKAHVRGTCVPTSKEKRDKNNETGVMLLDSHVKPTQLSSSQQQTSW
ncbi:hypothetical protein NDU88_007624 [Pleurodeles waltl]|uniref:Uncharacterized protein n=1 Tax=Pleurodeles waltl TaxID=8319 RepID=A0AAV7VU19_PLEWA|nr:hypothetical protein NDU88_007624 [Pleurodeles waltl]